jgi:hypothetical protein
MRSCAFDLRGQMLLGSLALGQPSLQREVQFDVPPQPLNKALNAHLKQRVTDWPGGGTSRSRWPFPIGVVQNWASLK